MNRRRFLVASASAGCVGVAGCTEASFEETWSTSVTSSGIHRFDVQLEEGSDIRLTQTVDWGSEPRVSHLALLNSEGTTEIAESGDVQRFPSGAEYIEDEEIEYEAPDVDGGAYTLVAGYAGRDMEKEIDVELSIEESDQDTVDGSDSVLLEPWVEYYRRWVDEAWKNESNHETWNDRHSWDHLVLSDHFRAQWPTDDGHSSPQFTGAFLDAVVTESATRNESASELVETLEVGRYRAKLGALHDQMRDEYRRVAGSVADLITLALRAKFGVPENLHDHIQDAIIDAMGDSINTAVGEISDETAETITFVFAPYGRLTPDTAIFSTGVLEALGIADDVTELKLMVPMEITAEITAPLPLEIAPNDVESLEGAIIETTERE